MFVVDKFDILFTSLLLLLLWSEKNNDNDNHLLNVIHRISLLFTKCYNKKKHYDDDKN